MAYNKTLQQLIDDLPANDAWWVGESDKYLVNAADYLQACCDEADWVSNAPMDYEQAYDFLEGIGEIKGDNTYNYNGNIDRDLDILSTKVGETLWIAFRIHRGGDVRGNYTDFIVMRFTSEYGWFEVTLDNTFTLDVDGHEFLIEPDAWRESHDVYCRDLNVSTDIVFGDITDDAAREDLRELIK